MSDQTLDAVARQAGLRNHPSIGGFVCEFDALARFAELVRADERQAFDAAVHERVGLHLASSMQAVRVRAIVRSGADDAQIGVAVRELVSAEMLPVDDVLAAVRADERERCALACEELGMYCEDDPGESFAAAIRALKNPA